MLLIKLRVAPNKLAPLVRKPRIRIVESMTGRKRRIREEEEEEEQPTESKPEPEKPFGGILTKADADTSKTTPTEIDRGRFERAREAAVVYSPKRIALIRDSGTVNYYCCEVRFRSSFECWWSPNC
jgi:hypothetical protein